MEGGLDAAGEIGEEFWEDGKAAAEEAGGGFCEAECDVVSEREGWRWIGGFLGKRKTGPYAHRYAFERA